MTLIEAVRATIRRLHYSPRTEEAYVHWIRAFICFHHGKHPRQMGAEEVTIFLNDLAVARRSAASTRNKRCARSSSFTNGSSTCIYPGLKRSNVPAGRSTSPRSSRDSALPPCSST
ncbi:site-specific integrase [Sorangium sp. So ce296]